VPPTGGNKTVPASWRNQGLLVLLTLMYAENHIGRQIIAVMVEPIKREFGVSDTAMGLISGLAFAAMFAMLGLPAGRLADRLPRTGLLAGTCLLWGISTVLCGLTGSFTLLVLARMVVAAAEAPVAPAALSLIADLYPPHRRSVAISLFSAAPTLAAIVALSLGAWVVETWGWRTAFIVVGTPALAISALLALGAREPQRGRWDAQPSAPRLGMRESVRALWAAKPVRYLILASALATLGGTAFGMWNASFLVRSYGLQLQHAGLLAGLVGGISAGLGVMIGGWLSDHLAGKRPHWQLFVPLTGHFVGLCSLATYLLWPREVLLQVGQLPIPTAMIWCAINGFFTVWWMGPSFALLTVLVPAQNRAMALALQTLIGTLLGVGLGPVLTGLISDRLQPTFGNEALRYAMLLSCCTAGAAIVLLDRVRRHMNRAGLPATTRDAAVPSAATPPR